jgi:hypothetical protein
MVMIYPKEGTLARNNCACLVTAPWVDAEEAAAAELWIDYLQEEQQQRAFMRAGFRPVTGIPLLPNDPDNRITAEFGLNPETPSKILDVSKIQPEVANEIDRRWEDVKRQSVVTFVVDTSGSMLVGGKLDKAKDGLTRALFNMPSNNKAGLVTFDDAVRTASPVNPLNGDARASLENAVKNMKAGGETALYDAIEIGIRMTDAADGDEDAIRAVVVLTDGQANLGATQLDHLVMMSSRDNEVPIRTFPGYFDHDAPMDAQGRTVAKNNVTGTGMILETTHDIQIFFIGIGDDADLDIGRILAEATGAEFQGVTEDDLANVLEELAGYF